MKFKTYRGQKLIGPVHISIKIDGVCAVRDYPGAAVFSKHDKPLHNVPEGGKWVRAEVFLGSWEKSVSAVRTHDRVRITLAQVYEILPKLDKRLDLGAHLSPSVDRINAMFEAVRADGHEGLVLIHKGQYYRRKLVESYDIKVTGVVEGKGKHAGRMGMLMTSRGGVGTGFTDAQREEFYEKEMLGQVIEVECSGLTPQGKFREPRFLRVRWDKS